MYGKYTTHLIRLCGVVHILNQVVNVIKEFPNASNNIEITSSFKNELISAQETILQRDIITIETVENNDRDRTSGREPS